MYSNILEQLFTAFIILPFAVYLAPSSVVRKAAYDCLGSGGAIRHSGYLDASAYLCSREILIEDSEWIIQLKFALGGL